MRKALLPNLLLSSVALSCAVPARAQVEDLLVVERRQDLSARQRLVQHLRGIKVTVDFADASAREVLDFLQAVSGKGVNFLLSSRTMKDADYPRVTLKLAKVSIANLMAAIELKTRLRFSYRAGLVLLKPRGEVREFTYLHLYDVRAAVMPIRNFKPKTRFGLRGSGDEGEVDTEEDESKPMLFDADRLVDLIKEYAVKDSWDRPGTSVESLRGLLMVKQSVRGHRKVQELLVKLGAIPAIRRRVVRRSRASQRRGPGRSRVAGGKASRIVR